ncbi:hypothetical protein PGT21_003011 [Puccinia graminis f. sp. tritici]|uniref:Uncharacterized protein n=1 Tax=Puccinia graminis f. sp. tritici TaxID=56615 RepID=A0A5B0PJJ2_PUCGR|nr:hypothetical protein PGT21_003011 [Puccinia graminis f. sp. tritici]
MIPTQLYLLLLLIGDSPILFVISTFGAASKKECLSLIQHPQALKKRAYPQRLLEPTTKWEVEAQSLRASGDYGSRDKQLYKKIQNYKIRIPSENIQDERLKVEQHQNLRLIYDTLALLELKERFTPPNVEILNRNLKILASGPKISNLVVKGVKGGASSFEMNLFDFLSKSFREDKLQLWCQLYDSWHSLNTNFLNEVSIILKTQDLMKASDKLMVKARIANSISKNKPKPRLSDVDVQTGRVHQDSSYLYTRVNQISPGIWKFCLPMKTGQFDVNFLTSNPIARLSWFLDDLDPGQMTVYAQALQKIQPPSLPELMKRQLILEQDHHTEPSKKFAQPSWFVQHMGWDHFQRIMLEFEKFPLGNNGKLKLRVSSQRGDKTRSSGTISYKFLRSASEKEWNDFSKKKLNDVCKKELNELLEKNMLLAIAPDVDISLSMMQWLRNFLTWLNSSEVQVRRFPTCEVS